MNFSKEQLEQLRGKLAAAKSPEEITAIAKELGYEIPAEDAAEFIASVRNEKNKAELLADDRLDGVNGGFDVDSIPQYQAIKDYYCQKGANLAFIFCIYFIPSPLCYEIVEVIEDELRHGIGQLIK